MKLENIETTVFIFDHNVEQDIDREEIEELCRRFARKEYSANVGLLTHGLLRINHPEEDDKEILCTKRAKS